MNKLTITTSSCYLIAKDIANQIVAQYGNSWSVYCASKDLGDVYFTYLDSAFLQYVVKNNISGKFYDIQIFMSDKAMFVLQQQQ